MAVVDENSKAPPGDPGGALQWAGLVAVPPLWARPDEGMAVPVLVVVVVAVEQVGGIGALNDGSSSLTEG